MTDTQKDLLEKASESLRAARLLAGEGFAGTAASRAYCTMFYVAEARLMGKGLAFSKHGEVQGAFGLHFAKQGDREVRALHQSLVRGREMRHLADYGDPGSVSAERAAEMVAQAQAFLDFGRSYLGPVADHEPEPSQ